MGHTEYIHCVVYRRHGTELRVWSRYDKYDEIANKEPSRHETSLGQDKAASVELASFKDEGDIVL